MSFLAVAAFNLLLFVAITSSFWFQSLHHHWIFTTLAAALLAEGWVLGWRLWQRFSFDARAARDAVLWALAAVLAMGIVRHETILSCVERCSLKLSEALCFGAAAFWLHGKLPARGFWSPRRSQLAALGSLLWAVYLLLFGWRVAPWALDGAFFALAAVAALGRSRALYRILAAGLFSAVAFRHLPSEPGVIALGLAVCGGSLAWAGLALDEPAAPRAVHAPLFRIALAVAFASVLGTVAAGPIAFMLSPAEREARLRAVSPDFAALSARSPEARRLRADVVALAQEIGDRSAYEPRARARALDYVLRRFKEAGYHPETLEYLSQGMGAAPNRTPFHNVEAVLPGGLEAGAWIVGAHYDTAPGTPGADDNASGVAVLLETARLLRGSRPAREIRFVAFGTEEPPAFGTQNMGSYRYAERLKGAKLAVHGMVSLEMLGYFNPRPGSQLYPPVLHLLYPDRGDFVGLVSNVSSRKLAAEFRRSWRAASRLPLETTILPSVLSGVALSDQLNFWAAGYPALLLSDTAFYRNPHYHQHTDTPEKLDYEKMAELARALARVLAR